MRLKWQCFLFFSSDHIGHPNCVTYSTQQYGALGMPHLPSKVATFSNFIIHHKC